MDEQAPIDFDDISRRMDRAITALSSDLGGLRTGRASASLLDPIQVEAYGSRMPLNQVATVSVPEARMISVQVWDGLNPVIEGNLFRIPIPELNEERRQEMVKVAHKYAEKTRISVRHIRRDVMDQLKKAEKASDISQDDARTLSDQVQKLTDEAIRNVDDTLSTKEAEIMQV